MNIAWATFLIAGTLASQTSWAAGSVSLPCGAPVEEMLQLQQVVADLERSAMDAYFHKSSQDAVPPLSGFVECLAHVAQKQIVPAELRSALQYDEMVARGRLARVLRIINKSGDADIQEASALALSKEVNMRIKSSDDLAALIMELDQKMSMRR